MQLCRTRERNIAPINNSMLFPCLCFSLSSNFNSGNERFHKFAFRTVALVNDLKQNMESIFLEKLLKIVLKSINDIKIFIEIYQF